MIRAIAVALFAAALFGCATERYLTEEQDERMRSHCEPNGCAVIPNASWERIEQILEALGLGSS